MLTNKELMKIQSKINYKFTNVKLLQQAFTRKTYSNIFGGNDNEVLEFLGDRILSYAVIRDLYDRFGRLNNRMEFSSVRTVGELSKIVVELVKNSNLAEQINSLGLKNYIQVSVQKEKRNPKNKADVFEAILGAIAVDSDWNLTSILNAYRSMMVSYEQVTSQSENTKEDYIDTFETLVRRFQICKTSNNITKGENKYVCKFVMIIGEIACQIHGVGNNQNNAISKAYEIGCKLINLVILKEFIPEMSYTEQLYFLYNNGFTSEPEFHFEYFPKNSNTPEDLCRCYGSFVESENEYITEVTNMTEAKEQACYAMLCEVLGIDYEHNETGNSESNQNYEAATSETIIRGQGLLKYILSMYKNVA